jgi:hypothetical protein
VNGAGFGFADTLALLPQVITGHPSSSDRRIAPVEQTSNGLEAELAAAQAKAIADQDSDNSASRPALGFVTEFLIEANAVHVPILCWFLVVLRWFFGFCPEHSTKLTRRLPFSAIAWSKPAWLSYFLIAAMKHNFVWSLDGVKKAGHPPRGRIAHHRRGRRWCGRVDRVLALEWILVFIVICLSFPGWIGLGMC